MTEDMTSIPKRASISLLILLGTGIGLKVLLLGWGIIPFNADEAVVALMARHMLQGHGIPVFFYGQAYMGSLDALLVAGGFALWGEAVWVVRAVQIALYAGTMITTVFIGRTVTGRTSVGLLAAALLAIPTVNVTLYTTASLGGYGEALLIGNILILISLTIGENVSSTHRLRPAAGWLLLWGIAAGLGVWANGLTLIYSAPTGLYLLWKLARAGGWRTLGGGLAWAVAGALLGAAPWLAYAAQNGMQSLLGELLGGAVSVESGSYLARVGSHLVNLILLGGSVTFGLRPPWEVRWLAFPLIPFVLILWGTVLTGAARKTRKTVRERDGFVLLWGVTAVLLAGYVFTSFGVDPSGRYFVPLCVPLSLFAADWLVGRKSRALAGAALALLLGFHAIGTFQSAIRMPPGLTTQFYAPAAIDQRDMPALIAFLHEQGETRGFTNYWVSYPLAFLSQEEIIFTPRLPYHPDLRYTERDDRYAPYRVVVEESPRIAYITTRNPALDEHIRRELTRLDVAWSEQRIGDFRVYYRLSRRVDVDELGLGRTIGPSADAP